MDLKFEPLRGTASTMLRLGFKNMIANWQVLPLRFGEAAAAVAVGFWLTKTIGFSIFIDLSTMNDHMFAPLMRHKPLVFAALVVLLLLIATVAMAVHSFIAAASTRVYLDGQRASLAGMPRPSLAAFRVFRIGEWVTAGKGQWWRLFRINLVTQLINLVNLALIVMLFSSAANHDPAAKHSVVVVAGCIGLPFLAIALFFASLWAQKAEVVCIAFPEASVRDSLRAGWSALRANLGVHVVTSLFLSLVVFIPVGVTLNVVLHRAGMTEPLLSQMQNIVASIVACWLLACFVAMTERA
jgi:hypothetical protein